MPDPSISPFISKPIYYIYYNVPISFHSNSKILFNPSLINSSITPGVYTISSNCILYSAAFMFTYPLLLPNDAISRPSIAVLSCSSRFHVKASNIYTLYTIPTLSDCHTTPYFHKSQGWFSIIRCCHVTPYSVGPTPPYLHQYHTPIYYIFKPSNPRLSQSFTLELPTLTLSPLNYYIPDIPSNIKFPIPKISQTINS